MSQEINDMPETLPSWQPRGDLMGTAGYVSEELAVQTPASPCITISFLQLKPLCAIPKSCNDPVLLREPILC